MDKTPEQYELNVKTLRQFEETFEKIKTEVVLKDPWEGMSSVMEECGKNLNPGDVVKAVTRAWRANNSCDSKVIVIGTPVGPLCLFQVTQGSSSGRPSVEERTFIQPLIPAGIYSLINKRIAKPMDPDDLAWLVNPEKPEESNIGVSLLCFVSNLPTGKPFKRTEF